MDEDEEEKNEENEEEKEEEDEEEEKEKEEEEEEEKVVATQYMDSFTLLSQPSTQIERSLSGDMALQDSDTSTDELQTDYNPPAKRSLKPSYYLQRRKRR